MIWMKKIQKSVQRSIKGEKDKLWTFSGDSDEDASGPLSVHTKSRQIRLNTCIDQGSFTSATYLIPEWPVLMYMFEVSFSWLQLLDFCSKVNSRAHGVCFFASLREHFGLVEIEGRHPKKGTHAHTHKHVRLTALQNIGLFGDWRKTYRISTYIW